MSNAFRGRHALNYPTLDALERCLGELAGAEALVAAAHLESAILALRHDMMIRGIEPDTDQSISAIG